MTAANQPVDPSEKRCRRQIAQLEECFIQVVDAVARGKPLDVRMAEIISGKRELGSRDRRLMKETIYAYFRWKGWIEALNLPMPAALAVAGHLAFSEPPPALQLLANDHRLRFQPVDASSLPAVKEWMERLSDRLLSTVDLVPHWVPGTLADAVKDDLPAAWQRRPPVWLRCLKNRVHSTRLAFERESYAVSRHPVLDAALYIDRAFPERQMFQKSENGFFIQDLASQVVSEVCLGLKAPSWWDVCAGSGGKSFSLASAEGTRVLASDHRPKITRILQDRKKALGLSLHVAVMDATKELPRDQIFDGVLVDAPCSGLGTWSRNPDHRWRTAESELKERAAEQKALLNHAAGAVASKGVLVYSVCTLTTCETTDIARDFLAAHPEFAAEPVPHPLDPETLSPELWVRPSDGPCNGMYIAVFRKTS